jgi:hypothetical protein
MRGGAFPFALAALFGIMNGTSIAAYARTAERADGKLNAGIYIFRPLVMEARIKRLQEQGADVGAVGNEAKMAQEIKEYNEKERVGRR